MEDAQSVTGFGSQPCYIVGSGDIMAEGEAHTVKRLNLFHLLTIGNRSVDSFDDPSGGIG